MAWVIIEEATVLHAPSRPGVATVALAPCSSLDRRCPPGEALPVPANR